MIPGSPSTPDMPASRRVWFAFIGLLIGITSGIGSSIVSANLPAVQGTYGLDTRQGAWLSAIYPMFNISMNLLLIKYRQQFGLVRFAKVFLSIYALATIANLFVTSYPAVLAVRALSGIAGASMGGLCVMYMMQGLPPQPKYKLPALLFGIGGTQIGAPLIWVLGPELLDAGGMHYLLLFQTAMVLLCLAGIQLVRLPPGMRIVAFEWRDIPSFIFLALGLGTLVAVATVGRVDWWLDAPWVGLAIVAAIICLATGAVLEHYRAHPMVDTRWVFTFDFLNFSLSLMLTRVLLIEQPFGVTGLVQTVGLGPDQTQTLYAIILAATVAGVLTSAFGLMLNTKLLPVMLLLALVLISVAAFNDAGATVDTRPANLFVTQAMMGFAAALFMGCALILGLGRLLARGLNSVVTFAMMFGVTQMLGGILGGSLLGTYQSIRALHHATYLAEGIVATDPSKAQLLQMYSGAYGGVIVDPALRSAQGMGTLAQQITQQANILAFNDVFTIIGWGAIALIVMNIFMFIALAKPEQASTSQ
ncbi:MFS transporter [Brevundimonas vancanneytii]|nr:MFS transporter [Brevundimonas vancanneytii]